jgi:DNA-binding beta-propeller fold protein YncE
MKGKVVMSFTLLLLTLVVASIVSSPAIAIPVGQIVVANRGSGNISVIHAATNAVMNYGLPSGPNTPEPMYVVYSPVNHRVFVGDRQNDRVVIFDANSFSVLGTIPAGRGVFHMWGDPLQNQLWVNNDIDKSITVIDMLTFAPITTFSTPADLNALGGKPHDVILDPTAHFAYVTMIDVGGAADLDFVVKYSTDTFMEVGRAAVGEDPHVSLSRHHDFLYLPSQDSDALVVLNKNTLAPVTSIALDNAHGAGMTANGATFYTTTFPGNGVNGITAINTMTNGVIGQATAPMLGVGPHNIGLSLDNSRLYITHTGGTSNTVSFYDISSANPIPVHMGNVTVGTNPFGIAAVSVPEPSTLALLLVGSLASAAALRLSRRRRE